MKTLIPFLLIFIIIFISCSKDDDNVTESNPEEPNVSIITATETCLYSDLAIEANSTVEINCLLDLEGKTIEVPEGVTFEFDGGDIFNGTLNFTAGGKIAGEILNSNLTVSGDVQLINEIFNFYPSRWGNIIEGEVTSEIALLNNTNLEGLFEFTKSLRASTFQIDKFNAYFEVTIVTSTTSDQNFYPSLEAINVPSDFNLMMTDNTNLRIFPGGTLNTNGGGILGIRDAENITISGGNLYGDRDERFYTADEDGEQGTHLLRIHSGRNITIDNIHFENGSGGSMAISSFGFPFNSDYNPTDGITISNCEFLNSRRMAIALTDGKNVSIINNSFMNTGQVSTNSTGGEVGYAINVEPFRIRDDNGDIIEYQKVTNALIKGNTETNSRGGFLTLTIGQDLIVEENTIDTRMVWSFVSGTKVRNNTFNASGSWASESWAFFAAGSGETVFDNEFSGNQISGYSIGMVIGSVDADIYENTITNVTGGIQISDAIGATVHDNIVESAGDGLRFANTTAENVKITGNTFTTSGFMARVTNTNNTEEEEGFTILIDNNDFFGYGAVSLFLTNGILFSNNTVQGGIQISDTSNSLIDKNIITPNEANGISLSNENKSITISNNSISEPTGADRFECLNNESTMLGEITLINNTCN